MTSLSSASPMQSGLGPQGPSPRVLDSMGNLSIFVLLALATIGVIVASWWLYPIVVGFWWGGNEIVVIVYFVAIYLGWIYLLVRTSMTLFSGPRAGALQVSALLIAVLLSIAGLWSFFAPHRTVLEGEDARQVGPSSLDRENVIAFAKDLKARTEDPQSFKLQSALMMSDGSACFTYRAKNSFGTEVTSFAVAFIGTNPRVPTMFKDVDGKPFLEAWNERCAHKTGEDLTPTIIRILDLQPEG